MAEKTDVTVTRIRQRRQSCNNGVRRSLQYAAELLYDEP